MALNPPVEPERPRLSPAMADARRAVRELLELHQGSVPEGSHFLVAVSGGADSLALAWAAQFVLPRLGYSLEAITIDHGLQPNSEGVAAEAASRLNEMDLRSSVIRVEVGSEGGLEHAARTARYSALRQAAREIGAHGVLLGHTKDDQAETVLLGLARGSGSSSISGMAAVSELWFRPFLGLRRETTRQVCLDAGLSWWNDPHNSDDRFLRPRVRHRVLGVLEEELGPGIVEALAATADLVRADDEVLDRLVDDALEPFGSEIAAGTLPVSALSGQPKAIASRMVRIAVSSVSGESLWRVHTDAVMALVTDWHGQLAIDVPGASVERVADMLIITPTKGQHAH